MKPTAVDIKPKRIVMPAAVDGVETDLAEGAALAKDIVNTQLRAVRDHAKALKVIDGDEVKVLRDMASVYETLAKIERDERKADALTDRLANMTDAELAAYEKELSK